MLSLLPKMTLGHLKNKTTAKSMRQYKRGLREMRSTEGNGTVTVPSNAETGAGPGKGGSTRVTRFPVSGWKSTRAG